ncbi:MAG TPA: glycosyltransferase family 87 protein [Polyangiaceae bacterium]|nr:glycosyltransferase family 87 protein [Polyangiaceae bacterium]
MIERFRASPIVRVCRVLFFFACLALSVQLFQRSLSAYLPRDFTAAHEFDALADWKGARLLLQGKSPYTKEGLALMGQDSMGHPPTTPFWYLPLADFDKSVAAQVSSALTLFLLPLQVILCARALRFPVPFATGLLVSAAVFSTAWFKYHYDVIQYSEAIAFLYVLAWLFLRQGRDAQAGGLLGAALTLKLFPGLMLVFLLVARRFRALFAAVASYLAVALVMTRAYGFGSWVEFFRQQGKISDDWLGVLQNSSLPGLVVRFATPACVAQGHPTRRATLISLGLSLVLVALAAWSSRAQLADARDRDPRAIDLPFALFVLLSAFLNAWAWEHYFVLTIQPLFVLLATLYGAWWATLKRWCAGGCSRRRLQLVSAVALLGMACVVLTVRALNADFRERDALLSLWFKYHSEFYHRHMHWLEIANFACWILPICACFLGIALTRNQAALGRARAPDG